ncbi:RteC domain-containing protein [Dysgonomonas macrotermitis]|uniref:RteC protein n=1 Tax=Dysgonomonas macrotermitis TaxID=1346286 RepID=A0A1M4VRN9_9BACT|nr:RteC domain-containing protein [Dysgonomonas macrotermitis]SHE71734.1 RteC protein [Dysgonomonas macrotermitis]
MEQFVKKLHEEVVSYLQGIDNQAEDNLAKAKKGILILEDVFHRLKSFIVEGYEFKSKEEEIKFFKEHKPKLFCNLIFYRKIYNLEMHRPTGGGIIQQDYFRKELDHINDYFHKNLDFYHYYRSDNTFMDEIFFLRGQNTEILLHLETFYFERDPLFSTNCDFKIAKILANNMLESYIRDEIEKLENKDYELKNYFQPKTKITWTGTKAELIELIYALIEVKVFNHGRASLKEVVCYFENIFNIELGANPSRTFIELYIRKIQTAFINKLQTLLLNKMEKENRLKKNKNEKVII